MTPPLPAILVDRRGKHPYSFSACFPPVVTATASLPAGDSMLGISYGSLRCHCFAFGIPIRRKDPWLKRRQAS